MFDLNVCAVGLGCEDPGRLEGLLLRHLIFEKELRVCLREWGDDRVMSFDNRELFH